jgi:hypothetical protein
LFIPVSKEKKLKQPSWISRAVSTARNQASCGSAVFFWLVFFGYF